MRNRSTLIWIAVVVLATVVGFTANAVASSGDRPSGPTRQITVSGTATVSTRPDEAVVDLGVRSEAAASADAMQANATKMTAVLKALADAGVGKQEISTTHVSLDRQTIDKGTKHERTVFVARNDVEVTITDLDQAGAVIDAAVQAGAEEVHDIRFQVSDPTEVRRQALQQAVRGARAKADAMADAADASVSGVISIREQGNTYPGAFEQRLAFDAVPAAVTPIVPTHDIETRVTVTVVWSLAS
jgi:uncharacterized protein YggE